MAETIADALTLLANNKAAIKQAIIDKGVAVSDNDALSTYADKIGSIEAGGGEMNCVYKEITVNSYSTDSFIAPIKDKRVIVRAENNGNVDKPIKIRTEYIDVFYYWYYLINIPQNSVVLILCDPDTETASLFNFGETINIRYYEG